MREPTEEYIGNNATRFERMIQLAPVAISIIRPPEFIIDAANKKQLDLWNRREEEVLGQPLFNVFPEVRSRDFEKLLSDVVGTGVPFKDYEVSTQLVRSGTLQQAWFNLIYEPVRTENGIVESIMVVSTEVTEQVLDRLKKEESEEKYRMLFNLMDQGFCLMEMLFDDSGTCVDYLFIECNDVFADQTGLVNAAGKTAKQLVPDLEERWFRIYGEVALTGKPNRFIEGSEVMGRWFEVYAFRVGDDQSRKVALLFTDITERKKAELILKESEARFRTVADQSPMIIYIVEPDQHATMSYFNQAWLDYTGMHYDDAIGNAWESVVHPEDVAGIFDAYMSAFEKQEPYTLPAIRLRRHDGLFRWHLFRGAPRKLPSGEFIGYIGVGFDIHEQKLAEHSLKLNEEMLEHLVAERTKELKRSNQDLQHFAHVASHDLREPVRKIKTFESRIRAESPTLSSQVAQYLAKIDSAANRMSAMIDGVLLYSSVDGFQHSKETVNLNEVIDLIETDLEVLVETKDGIINRSQLPFVHGTQVLIYQLFYNLIVNSLKFAKANEPPVINICVLENGSSINGLVGIEVCDNGIGFHNDYAGKIFDTFLRLHSKDTYEGSGLGLALCKKIAERHGGSITAYGEVGVGATFHVYLPAGNPA